MSTTKSTKKSASRKRKAETAVTPAAPPPLTLPMSERSMIASKTLLSMFEQKELDAKRMSAIAIRDILALDDQPLASAIASQFAEGCAYLMGRHNELYHLVQQAEGASHAD